MRKEQFKINAKTYGNPEVTVNKVEFTNINDLTSYIKDEAKTNTSIFKSESALNGAYSFTMTNSMNEALQILSEGWTRGAEDLTTALKIANRTEQPKEVKRAIYDVVGFQASVPRYLQGIPTSMVNKKTVKQKQKVINIYKSVAYNAAIRPKQILDDSVKFLQIVQAIEAKGIKCNVYTSWHSGEGREQVWFVTKVKSSDERLNLSKLGFPLLHPSFLRRFMFRVLECNTDIKSPAWENGYGRPLQSTKDLLKDNEYFVPAMMSMKEAEAIMNDIK